MADRGGSEQSMKEMGFLSHLIELRDRLMRAVLAIGVAALVLFPFSKKLYAFLAAPLLEKLAGGQMIATGVAAPFLAPFKLVLVLAIVITVPYLLHQLWSFVAPGLYQHEKRLALPLLVSSVVLFYLGMAFAYFVVFPLVFGFFTSVAPEGVQVAPDISEYLNFTLKLFLAFGIAFEVPVATVLVIWTGMTSAEKLARLRPYIIVIAFTVGMLMTPPDVVSQVLLAVPMWLLFELGLLFSRYFVKPRPAEADEAELPVPAAAGTAAAAGAGASGMQQAFEEALIAEEPPYRPLTEEEMDAELDRLEEEEDEDDPWADDDDDEAGEFGEDDEDDEDDDENDEDDGEPAAEAERPGLTEAGDEATPPADAGDPARDDAAGPAGDGATSDEDAGDGAGSDKAGDAGPDAGHPDPDTPPRG